MYISYVYLRYCGYFFFLYVLVYFLFDLVYISLLVLLLFY